MGRIENFRIGRACPLLVVVKRLKPLTALSGTVYRLASSMSSIRRVFNVFEDWNEECVVLHISFYSIRIRFARKRPIRRSLISISLAGFAQYTLWTDAQTGAPRYMLRSFHIEKTSPGVLYPAQSVPAAPHPLATSGQRRV